MKMLWKRALPLLLCLVTLVTLFPMQPVQAADDDMKTSAEYIKLLKGWEGFRATPYWDVSHYSIGYGTTCPDDKVDYYTKNPMSEATAEQWLQSSLVGFENSVNSYAKKYGLKLTQNQFDALVSFTYNCGASWTGSLNGYFNTAVRYGDKGRMFLYGIGLYGNAGGDYILMRRRMREANIYLNGQYTNEYPDNYRWVFVNGGGAKPCYPVYAFDANKPEAVQLRFDSIPTGKKADGSTFIYELAGWYTADGKEVKKLDASLTRGQIIYARWKDPDGKVVKLPTGTPVNEQKLTIVKSSANIRTGPGTYYDKTGELKKGDTLTLKETYEVGSTTWGNTDKGWLSLGNTDYVPPKDTYPKTGKVNASGVNYRKGPGTSYDSYGKMSKNEKITITEVNDDSSWGKFTKNGKTCWISLKYVDFDAEVATKVEILRVPTKVNYESTKKPLELEGSIVRITYANGKQLVRSIAMSDVKDNRTEDCISATVTVTVGGKSDTFQVTFKGPSALKITKQPVSTAAQKDKKIAVSIGVTGDGLSYQWYYKDKNDSKFSTSTNKTNTYTTTMTTARNGRQIYCVVKDKYGNKVQTNTATLSISNLKITKQPVGVRAPVGQNTAISVAASGEGIKYQWYYKRPDMGAFAKSTQTTATYAFTITDIWDNCQVYCVVSDKYGASVKTNTVAVTVKAPAVTITKQPFSVAVAKGQTATVSFNAVGDGLTYKWYYKNKNSSKFVASTTGKSNTYTTEMTSDRDGRQLYCVVTDADGNKVQTNTVTISIANLKITKQPVGVSAPIGKSSSVSVAASGTGVKYQWYYKRPDMATFEKSAQTTATYSFTVTDIWDNCQVYCVITDQAGASVKSNTVKVVVLKPAQITKQPQSVIAAVDQKAAISVTASGTGVKYQWYYKRPDMAAFDKSTQTTATYSFTVTDIWQNCQVYCVVTGQDGSSVKSDTVTVMVKVPAVTITKQPAGVQAAVGEESSVSVTAEGEELKYQWYYKRPDMAAFDKSTQTTDTYSFTVTDIWHNCQVYCVITDPDGAALKTDTVKVMVKKPVTITMQPVSISASVGQNKTISVTAEGEGLKYQWYYKRPDMAAFDKSTQTTATYAFTVTDIWDDCQVYCVITDANGKTAKTNTVVVTVKAPALAITKQPVSASAPKGKTVTVSFVANGEGLTYTWYYKNKSAKSFTKSGIGKGNTYAIEMTSARNGRQVYCVVKDKYGNKVQTNTVTLTMK